MLALLLGVAVAGALARTMYQAVRWGPGDRTRARLLARATASPIATAGEGQLVRVVGRLIDDQLLTAPITGRRCAYWTVEVAQQHPDHRKGHRWVFCESSGRAACTIEDASGRARLDLDGATIDRDRTAGVRIVTVGAEAVAAHAWLVQQGLVRGLVQGPAYRVREFALSVEDVIAVVGVGVRELDPHPTGERGYRDGPPTRLHFSSTARNPLLITDPPT